MITGLPILVFLGYDLWYRTVTAKKPYHHPDQWPVGLYVYVLLYQVSGIMLNGYAFLVALFFGYVVLASYFGSLTAYGCVQVGHHKNVGTTIEEWQKKGWRLHAYQASGPYMGEINHYLLFAKGD